MRGLRTLLGAVGVILVTLLGGVGCLLSWLLSPSGRLGAWVTHAWARGILRAGGVRLEIHTEAALPDGACLFVANHTSMLDICATAAALPRRFHFVSRPFFFRLPILGWGMWLARHLSLDPQRPREAAGALARVKARLASGGSILMFPEGTRSEDGTLQRYKRGPFVVALEAGVPVVPVRLVGARERLPKGSLRIVPGTIRMTIGAAMRGAGLVAGGEGSGEARALADRAEAWTRGEPRGVP